MPRLGLGMPITAGLSQEAVTTIDDFFFESQTSGEVNPILTTSRTNLVTYSENFTDNSWTLNNNATITSSTQTAPDGSSTASLLNFTQQFSNIQTTNSPVTSGTATVSFHLKRISGNTTLYLRGTGSSNLYMDAITVTDEWQRYTATFSHDGTNNIGLVLQDRASSGFGSVLIWGAQIEQDGFVSAYIPTSGSTVTVSTTLNDTSNVWDFDSTDITLEADPEDEGFWEEGSNLVTNHDYDELSDNFVEVPGFETTYTSNQWLAFSSPSTLEISTEQAHEGSSSLKIAGTDGKGVQASATQFSGDYSVNDVVEITAYVYPTISPDNRIKTGVNNSDRSITTLFTGLTLNQWNKIQYQVTISTASNNYISFLNSGTGEFYLDNVSARIVDPNNRWTLSNTTIEDGALKFVDNTSAAQFAVHTNTSMMDIGGAYEITLNVNRTSGSFRVLSGTGASTLTPAISINSSGTQTFRVTNDTNGGKLYLYTDTGENFIGTVDNITVREYAIQPQDV